MYNLSLNTNEINVFDVEEMCKLEEVLLDNGDNSDEWFTAFEALRSMLDMIDEEIVSENGKELTYDEQRALLSIAKTGFTFAAKPE